jgi:hypothetical protein
MTTKHIMKTYMHELYEKFPISQNNGARIIQSKIDKMQVKPSESLGQEIEQMSGLPSDFSEKDWGIDPQQLTDYLNK